MTKEFSKEGSKEFVDVVSWDNSLAKGPRTLRCCHVGGLNQTDQYKVGASLIYAGQCRLSKEGSKEFADVISLELSLDNSLAKGPRTLRCCLVHGLIPTDQCEVVASLI